MRWQWRQTQVNPFESKARNSGNSCNTTGSLAKVTRRSLWRGLFPWRGSDGDAMCWFMNNGRREQRIICQLTSIVKICYTTENLQHWVAHAKSNLPSGTAIVRWSHDVHKQQLEQSSKRYIKLNPCFKRIQKVQHMDLSITKHHYIIITSADTRYWRAAAWDKHRTVTISSYPSGNTIPTIQQVLISMPADPP